MANKRTAIIKRVTKETAIELTLALDGSGKSEIKTPIPFFNHMLESLARHGLFDLKIKATGDVDVDDHHLVEDVGLVLGQAFLKALGSKEGLTRYGHFTLPMDEVLTTVAVDFCGRPCFVYDPKVPKGRIKKFDLELVKEFFVALVNEAGLNLHFVIHRDGNKHHVVESMFKAFARAMSMACRLDSRVCGLPSTKGAL